MSAVAIVNRWEASEPREGSGCFLSWERVTASDLDMKFELRYKKDLVVIQTRLEREGMRSGSSACSGCPVVAGEGEVRKSR